MQTPLFWRILSYFNIKRLKYALICINLRIFMFLRIMICFFTTLLTKMVWQDLVMLF
ncbi:hypothetical protein C414_000260089 [Campylobacter jejuni subsp. jejuni 414]|nr:hypothetical protein C414_000260089 [Campylobacter jejuni subsp. jejuni 414]